MNEIFNSREVSNFIWITVAILALLLIPTVRKSMLRVLRLTFVKQLVVIYCWMFAYVSLVVCILFLVGLWNTGQIKNTIIWVLFSGFGTLFSINKIQEQKDYFKQALKDIFKFTVVSEFFIGLFTFDLVAELIFIPVVAFLVMLHEAAKIDPKNAQVAKFLNVVLTLLGLGLFVYAGYHLIVDFKMIATMATVFDFVTPLLLSLLFLPFIYFLSVYMSYQCIFAILVNPIKDSTLRRFAKNQAIIHFHFRTKDLERWKNSIFLFPPASKDDVLRSVKKLKALKEIEQNPPEVTAERGWSPYKAKDFLLNEGIETRHYQNVYDDEWSASSNPMNLADGIVSNTITYYISGDSEVAKDLNLTLNMHWREGETAAHAKFFIYGEILYKAALGRDMPDTMKEALLLGKPRTIHMGNKIVSIKKELWPGHRLGGYSVALGFIVDE